MKIASSTVALAAQRSYQEQRQTALNIRIEQRGVPAQRQQVELSDAGKALAAETSATGAVAGEQETTDPKLLLIKSLVEALTGREFKLFNMQLQDSEQVVTAEARQNVAATQENEGGFAIDYREVYEESEAVSFRAAGIIRTADGREIEFRAELDMARSYREEFSFSVASGSLAREKKDPLVLNYAASAATLSSQTFAFDIDSDGQRDNISLLNAGSAFLALDRNQDGKVNDGSELFGTRSGDGFADLAGFDSDSNGWIDEGDAVFAKLKLWIKDDSGTDKLVDLKSSGVGALYLGRASTDFSLTDADNQELGQTRATGIYLNENGSGGTLQQVDLAV